MLNELRNYKNALRGFIFFTNKYKDSCKKQKLSF